MNFQSTYPSLWISRNLTWIKKSHMDKVVGGTLYYLFAGDTHFHCFKDKSGSKRTQKINFVEKFPFPSIPLPHYSNLLSTLRSRAIWREGRECHWLLYPAFFLLGCYRLAAILHRRPKLLWATPLHPDLFASGIWNLSRGHNHILIFMNPAFLYFSLCFLIPLAHFAIGPLSNYFQLPL